MAGADEENAAALRRRATALRAAVARGRIVARALGDLLDGPVRTAQSEGLWSGTFADDTAADLQQQRDTLRDIADDLMGDATAWGNEAERLEELANEAEAAANAPAGAQ